MLNHEKTWNYFVWRTFCTYLKLKMLRTCTPAFIKPNDVTSVLCLQRWNEKFIVYVCGGCHGRVYRGSATYIHTKQTYIPSHLPPMLCRNRIGKNCQRVNNDFAILGLWYTKIRGFFPAWYSFLPGAQQLNINTTRYDEAGIQSYFS